MKKLYTTFMVLCAIFTLSACSSDLQSATQKDMINRSSFIHDYNDSDDSHNFKLTIEKDYTYTLYIRIMNSPSLKLK